MTVPSVVGRSSSGGGVDGASRLMHSCATWSFAQTLKHGRLVQDNDGNVNVYIQFSIVMPDTYLICLCVRGRVRARTRAHACVCSCACACAVLRAMTTKTTTKSKEDVDAAIDYYEENCDNYRGAQNCQHLPIGTESTNLGGGRGAEAT